MEWLNVSTPAICLTGILLLVLIKLYFLQKEHKRLLEQFKKTSHSLELNQKELHELQSNLATKEIFQKKLSEAALLTRLQQPQMESQPPEQNSSTPEKYCYVHALIQKGMSIQEIGTVLNISPYEAKQLVTLSKIASGSS